jgi:hypothetical protein
MPAGVGTRACRATSDDGCGHARHVAQPGAVGATPSVFLGMVKDGDAHQGCAQSMFTFEGGGEKGKGLSGDMFRGVGDARPLFSTRSRARNMRV